MKTTLNKIKETYPCLRLWYRLLEFLGKTEADDDPVSISTIITLNGFDDALWCLQTVDGYDKELRLYAVWCARHVEHLMEDERSIKAVNVVEVDAHGNATKDELLEAWYMAREARSKAWLANHEAVYALKAVELFASQVSTKEAQEAVEAAAATEAVTKAALIAAEAAWAATMLLAGKAAWVAYSVPLKEEAAKELMRLCAEIELKETK